ncbi:class I SAM-dependent methyltransferase [Allonocardiopsis opalescens]|uniref:dTDP-3-amino-3,6-dideoxy-alpha-D-glucopyranose N,N-dimethyltransferase/dTDP-3-amino-3,4, 6-trideoxy-alpha-D-glucopyranose N,N-dimethyltransferase/N-methyltransferase n=1 Tax=Allonocardiopsis opalescens TaxID=1144618 RepID=A0A2T0Q9B4_9ACTN|nr:class I SAM-dependent methyltransferase [Allonocardiopsis opalescens]PRY00458.1 dTDP-3-amino-3,6-dideoxy-alpha-D-glucopyranose N,N-dimethyltransferase/dTDP-3-amino-3,4,6-trideoxy-alpha-D-glucopyranose N,N-dimethyltransferase/N-methyltransferase [Allonocardiopsis opalescens]
MYDGEFAEIYELFYTNRGKDHAREAADVAALVRERCPGASSLLDVACGTGAHLRHFTGHFARAEGLELAEDMAAIAARRAPGARVTVGDMRDFALGRRFSAVTCMFSSIAHLSGQAELDAAFACFARHTEPGGVLVVEPWWFPETFIEGYVAADIVRAGERTLARVSHSVEKDGVTVIDVHYVLADPVGGARHLAERHHLTLHPREGYERAAARAGYQARYLEGGPSGRGLFVAILPAAR